MSSPNVGDHVLADFDGDGYVIAHVLDDTPDADGKYGVQKHDGTVKPLTWREPADLDASGSGGTFKKV